MNRKLLLISIFSILFFGVSALAQQRQKATDRFFGELDWDFNGDYVYQYIKQPNGKNLEDGPFTMKAIIDQRGLPYKNKWHKADVVGKYNLTGNHSKGNLHGPLTMDANLNIKATNGDNETITYAFRGNFKNGIPDGNFSVNYPSYDIKVNVNYRDGVLVGSYYVRGMGDDYLYFITSGTFTQTGKMTGKWNFNDVDGKREWEFLNGVIVNRSDYDTDLIAKARSYAAGKISKKSLMAQNICVKCDSMALGYDAYAQILHKGIAFDQMGGYSFVRSKTVRYEYLDRLPFFTEEGFSMFKEALLNNRGDFSDLRVEGGSNYYDSRYMREFREFYRRIVNLDMESGLHYCTVHKSSPLCDLCVGYPDWSQPRQNIYFTDEQLDELRTALHETRMSRIDEIPIEKLNYTISNGQEYRIAEDFITCTYDENIVTFVDIYNSSSELLYYNRDTFEDYFINLGYGKEILELSPETRHEVILKKIEKKADEDRLLAEERKREEEARKQKLKEEYSSVVTTWFNNALIGQPKYRYSETRDLPDSLYPIISYTAKEVILPENNNSYGEIFSTVNVRLSDSEILSQSSLLDVLRGKVSGPQFRTYDIVVYVYPDGGVDMRKTFVASNFVRVKNDYDIIEELDSHIQENNKRLKTVYCSVSKDGYKAYESYMKDLDIDVDHNDLKSSIKQYQEIIALQDTTFMFVEKLGGILKNDEALRKVCAVHKDIAKVYDTYMPTRDLTWSPAYDFTKFDQYISDQNHLQQFVTLRDAVANNHASLLNKKSVARNIHKAYLIYYNGCDLSWNPQKELSGLEELISVQERCVALISQDNIAEIDKSVKKQKIIDIEQILSMTTIAHGAPAPTTKKETDAEPKAEDKPLVEAKNVEPEPKLEKELKPTTVKKQNVPNNGFRTKGLINSFELSYNAQFASDRYVSLQDIGNYPYSTVHPIEFNYLIGYRFCNWVSLSFGTGIVCDMVNLRTLDYAMNSINYSGPTYSTLRIPVFLNVKTYMTDTKIQPMASLSVGGTSPSVVDFLDLENWTLSAELGVGCNVRTGNRGNLYFLLSAKMMPMPYFETYSFPSDVPGQSYTKGWYGPLETVAASIKVGFMF